MACDRNRGLKATAKFMATLRVEAKVNSLVPRTESEYRQLVELLDSLIDEVGENESHPLASFMQVVGILIEKYEDEHVPELAVD